jgi:hypothetical protein
MRHARTLGALAFALLGETGAPLVCDPGCLARAESARLAPETRPETSGSGPIPFEQEHREYERLIGAPPHSAANGPFDWLMDQHGAVHLLHLDHLTRGAPLVGDFWLPGEFERHLQGRPLSGP